MSDVEDDTVLNSGDPAEDHEEEQEKQPSKSRRRDYDEDEEEEEEEDDEEDEEEEDDEDEDEGTKRGQKRAKHRHKKPAVNRFLDVEAEVDEDEDEEEEEDEYARDEFIADAGVEGEEDFDTVRRAADHARYDRRVREMDDRELEQVAEDISQRYRRTAVRYTGEMSDVPQRLLMPSVHDANLWQVRVRPGKERDIVFSLMRKAIDLEYGARPLQILSAFQRDSLPGMIYVEARSAKQVSEAINGLVGVFPSRGINLVPIEEMASLLQIKQQELTVTPGSWVRIKRGKYQGDLAQVMDVTENGEEVGLKFIPRIDLNPKDEASLDGRKRKKAGTGLSSFSMRPPQRFFNYEEVVKVYGRKSVSKRNQVFVFQNDTYKDGFIEKDFRLTALQLDDVNPTLDEITRFTRGQDGNENESNVDLSIIAEASRKAAISVLQPGDHVEVFEGEQSGVHGTVHSIEQDVVTIEPEGVDFDGQRVQIPARSVRKRFKPGDHVKVMTGKNSDETGLVVSVLDNVVTFLSDMSMQEVSVFSKDLREAAEVGTGTNIVGNYELHDLVQLDQQTVGVIFKTERDSFRVLDQNGQVRLVQPHQITMRRDSNRAIAVDSEGHELRRGDNVKEVDGEGRKGRVLHTHQSFFAFLHNRDYNENGGVFVTRARSLASLAPKGNAMKLGATDLSKMNPALSGGAGGMVGSGMMGRGPRDRLIGVSVMVIKGPSKGYVGTIKDTNGPHARVELLTGNKVITIDKEKLRRRNPDGSLDVLEKPMGGMGPPRPGGGQTPNPYNQGGERTPAWGANNTGRTPNPYNDSRTPAWSANSRTPNPYADHGKTPAWDATARTPNPYAQAGGKTPAWNSSSRTPNPYAGANSSSAPTWGGATPGRPSGSGWDTWDTRSAPTPFSAFTPGAPTPAPYVSLQTPAIYEYQTPAQSSAYPHTPGFLSGGIWGNIENTFELSPKWLLDPNLADKVAGIMVEVRGSYASAGQPGWHNADYEGKQGVVLSVFNTDNDTFQSTARVRFFQPVDPLQPIVPVPVTYLWPVHPEKKGEDVIILSGAQGMGQEARVEAVESRNTMVLTTKATFLVIDSHPERLVRTRQVDEVGNFVR
ncbi:transcription elongation factor Spt5 [Lentinus brumalis]|uniref:Transcription elongation factor SPT5 n=1 Tax=Lentinus brumalis TaxID=2498619 RepID=A0A371DIU4_9APHY|nr:transcription elongation factor Spt5 [Polyporus brumalis]